MFKNLRLKTVIFIQACIICMFLSMNTSIHCDHCEKPTPVIRGICDYFITEISLNHIPVIHFECFDCYIRSDGKDDDIPLVPNRKRETETELPGAVPEPRRRVEGKTINV